MRRKEKKKVYSKQKMDISIFFFPLHFTHRDSPINATNATGFQHFFLLSCIVNRFVIPSSSKVSFSSNLFINPIQPITVLSIFRVYSMSFTQKISSGRIFSSCITSVLWNEERDRKTKAKIALSSVLLYLFIHVNKNHWNSKAALSINWKRLVPFHTLVTFICSSSAKLLLF